MEHPDARTDKILRKYGWRVAIRPEIGEAIWTYRAGNRLMLAVPESRAIETVKEWQEKKHSNLAAPSVD